MCSVMCKMCIFRIKILYLTIHIIVVSSLREKCPCLELFWFAFSRILPHSDWIWMDTYSIQMRENPGKIRSRITPNADNFYVVFNVSFGLLDHNISHTNAVFLEFTCRIILILIKITTKKLWIWSHLLKKSLMENFIIWVVWSIYLCIVINSL